MAAVGSVTAGIGIAYAVVALLLAYAVPSVRDAAPEWLPPGLTILFRTFTAVGTPAAMDGHCLCHRRLPPLPRARGPRVSAVGQWLPTDRARGHDWNPTASREPRFPFTAIVGQTPMKRALLLNAINPRIGGVLVRGKKGTAKSTAVRSLAALLAPGAGGSRMRLQLSAGQAPQEGVPTVPGRQSAPDRRQCGAAGAHRRSCRWAPPRTGLVGSLDIEQAIKSGEKNFEPGLIAAAHRGILYIDEVNLLNDHLVDVLLDAAAMGRNYVEREGISVSHEAEFMLVGTMNPEEGDLRPQLLDRFGLGGGGRRRIPARAERREVVRRRMAFEAAPFDFMDGWAGAEQAERDRLLSSQRLLSKVIVPDDILELITDICAEYQVDGLRGDIVMYKTASTIAAYEGRTVVDVEDVREAALMALLHRQRRQPFQQPHLVTEQLDNMLEDFQNQQRNRETSAAGGFPARTIPPTIAIENLIPPDERSRKIRPTPLWAMNGSKWAILTRYRTCRCSRRTGAPAGHPGRRATTVSSSSDRALRGRASS